MSSDDAAFRCPDHGPVTPSERQHDGRAHAFVCPEADCNRTVTSTTVDWDAYEEAKENDETPPCPACGSEDVGSVPASPPFVCRDCHTDYGWAGAYRP